MLFLKSSLQYYNMFYSIALSDLFLFCPFSFCRCFKHTTVTVISRNSLSFQPLDTISMAEDAFEDLHRYAC